MSGFERWGAATERALYGRAGFYRRETPASHFTTSARTPVFAEAIARVADEVDERLGRPEDFTVVDVGAGGGDLLADLAGLLDRRISLVGVELRPRPAGLPERITWRPEPPDRVSGLIVACELLDNVPCDVAVLDPEGRARYEEVDPEGRTRLGETLEAEDERWLDTWWPLAGPGDRAEIGRTRDTAWADLTARLDRGAALAVDYGHTRSDRPQGGTLTGFAHGRQTEPIPDGARDVTAHVAVDAIACDSIERQRDALHALGFTAARPPMALAYRNPTAYALALAKTTATARLTDPAGLGGHWWLRTDR